MAEFNYSHHIINGLKSATFTSESPWKQEPKLKGSCAKGKTYERTIYRRLKAILNEDCIFYNKWIRFEDKTGTHFAQPDIFIVCPSKIFLLEVKRTQTLEAELQLKFLYKPLLEYLFPSKEVFCVQVCKNLRTRPKNEINALREARDPSIIYTYHCLGEIFNV